MKIRIDRVVIDPDGSAISPERAEKEYHVYPGIIFLREDGWTLAAPAIWTQIAYHLWQDYWTHFSTDGETWRPIAEYDGA